MADAAEALFDVDTIARNAEAIFNRIVDAGGDLDRVRLLSVTKALDPSAARGALRAGLFDLGENYVQELASKAEALSIEEPDLAEVVRWHFIGGLQRNKINQLPEVALIHSVDRVSLARAIATRRPGQAVLVQVNIGDESNKGGCAPGDTAELVAQAVDAGLDVVGLMGVARVAAPDDTQRQFELLAGLADRIGLAERSMGMSSDLDIAVRAGSTMVRVGTALFGPRPPRG